ncbi:hypothetical protein IJI55_02865, partial [Candidatus Saccharibacteria bacterium]|nr:hypothetical protein [Candidatus Saccharibacteria bacterium]
VGTYDVELTLDAFGRVLTASRAIEYSGTPMIQSITTMQQMTTDICKTAAIGYTKNLRDTRGMGNGGSDTISTYGIIKAKDSNCWMTDNLNLYNKTVTSSDTDFSYGGVTIPNSSTSDWDTSIPELRVYRGSLNQVYYNWCISVSSLSTCSSLGSASGNMNQSICPKNWKLPWYDDYWSLIDKYGLTSGAQLVSAAGKGYALGFHNYYGVFNWYEKQEKFVGSSTRMWTATYKNFSTTTGVNNHPYALLFTENIIDASDYNGDYKMGYPIRCLAR